MAPRATLVLQLARISRASVAAGIQELEIACAERSALAASHLVARIQEPIGHDEKTDTG